MCVLQAVLSVDHPAHALLQMLANTATRAVSICLTLVHCLCVCDSRVISLAALLLPQQDLQGDTPCSQPDTHSMLLSSVALSVLCAPVSPAMHDQSTALHCAYSAAPKPCH